MKKQVLVVAYAFPPVGGAGVQRISKFVKYLPGFSWKPIVLTVKNPSVPVEDIGLLKDIPRDVQVIHTITFEPSYSSKMKFSDVKNQKLSGFSRLAQIVKRIIRKIAQYVLIPDPQILWWPGASLGMIKILRKKDTDIIFVSAPPYSSLLLAVFWGRIFKVPVVVDFRDEWIFYRNSSENAAKGKIFDWFDRKMEGWVLRNATLITVASPAYSKTILRDWPNLDQGKISTITNGYDSDDFEGIKPIHRGKDDNDKFIIVYTGTVWKATSLKTFSRSLDRAIKNGIELNKKVILRIIGRVVNDELPVISEIGQRIAVQLYGYLKHEEAISHMLACDALLLTLTDMPGAEKIIPGKTFEYLAIQKPIIALVPEGACKEILLGAKFDNQISFNEFFLFPSGIEPSKNDLKRDLIDFSRHNLTKKLVDVFYQILNQ